MAFERAVACVAVAAAGFAAVGVAPAAGAQALTCPTTPLRAEPVELGEEGLWRYTFSVTWCVRDGAVAWAEPETTYELHSARCAWLGSLEEYSGPVQGGASWREFNMNGFACRKGEGTEAVNPWGEFILHATGAHEVRSGVEAGS